MGFTGLRKIIGCAMLLLFPLSVFSADTGAAMLYAKGAAWINGSVVPRSSAIFPGDLLQTRNDSIANINLPGTSVVVLADSLVQFDSSAIALDHGSVTVNTSRGMSARAGGIVIKPAHSSTADFLVTDVNGTVEIAARKGDLLITDGTQSNTLPEGQQTTREEEKNRKKREGGAIPAAGGGILDSKYAIIVGTAAVGGLTAWALAQGDDPLSPATPAP